MSSTGTGLTAGWAVWGKPPGSRQGYHVMAAWPPEWSSPYNKAIQDWSPGTPAPTDTLPWITIGPGRMPDGQLGLGVYVLHGTGTSDAHNRPINRITHFWVPYRLAAGRGLGWTSLARAALGLVNRTGAPVPETQRPDPAQDLPAPAAAPHAVELPIGADEHLMREVDEVFTSDDGSDLATNVLRWHAAVAARLLDGPVVVTGGPEEDPLERLRLLDNIAAMLPFALRSTVSAATATSSGANHRIHLSWGRPAPGVVCVPWQAKPPALDVLSPAALQYHDLLLHAWDSRGGPAVLAHLARATGLDAHGDVPRLPLPEQAYAVLSALDDSLSIEAQALRGQPVAVEVVDDFLRDPRTSGTTVRVMLQAKMSGPSTDMSSVSPRLDDPEVARLLFGLLAQDLLAGPLESVQERISSLLFHTATDGPRRDVLDRSVASLVTQPQLRGQDIDITSTLRLLPSLEPFEPDSMPFTRGALAALPEHVHGLLHAVSRGPMPAAKVLRWLDWLSPAPGDETELPLLRDLLVRYETSTWAPQPRWAAKHPDACARLLDLAIACGRGDAVLSGQVFDELRDVLVSPHRGLRRTSGPRDEPAALRALLRGGPCAPLDPRSEARWDLLCALAGQPPTAAAGHHRTPPTRSRLDTYATFLRQHLSALRPRERTIAGEVLLRHLLHVDAATGLRPGDTARAVTERLVQAPTDQPLCRLTDTAVTELLARDDWRAEPEDTGWLRRLGTSLPSLGNVLELYSLRDAVRTGRLTASELALQLRAARLAGVTAADLCKPVGDWAARHPQCGNALVSLLDAYLRVHAESDDPSGPSARTALEWEFSRGRLGQTLWSDYYTAATASLRTEEDRASEAIRTAERHRETVRRRLRELTQLHSARH
ncbi:hypothetical protein [Streptomyces sp. NPDC002588]|uniref:hypothetical protein n=1 Tax=Streptomyces sp. NPDC002588 TaxID=3154419 RepID=UPI003331331C